MTPSIPGITIYNKCKKENPETGRYEEAWNRTQIRNVHWTGADSASIVSMGLSSNTKFFCRIPLDRAEFEGNKQYIKPPENYVITDYPGTWTAQPGDYVFEGFLDDESLPESTHGAHEVILCADHRNVRLTKRTQHWRLDLK